MAMMSLTDDVTSSMTDNPSPWDPHPTASPSLSEVAAPTLDSARTNPSPPSHLSPPPDPPLLLPSPLEAVVAAAAVTVAERAQSPWGAETGLLAVIGGSGGSTRASQQSDGGGRTTQQQGGGAAGRGQQQHPPEAGAGGEPAEPVKASKSGRARSKERRDGRSAGGSGTSSRKRGDSAPRSPSRSSRPCHADSSLNGGAPAPASAPGTIPPDAPVSQQREPLMAHKAQPARELERGGKESRSSHHPTKSQNDLTALDGQTT